jgi:hypothetical protein
MAKNSSSRLSQTKFKTQSQPKDAGVPRRRRNLFGRPPLLEGEDGTAYDELLARVRAAVNPADILDEMFIADVVSLEWEILRLARWKWSLTRECGKGELQKFLDSNLDYDDYSESFTCSLTETLHRYLSGDQPDSVESLAYKCAQNQKEAVDRVNAILDCNGLHLDSILNVAKWCAAEELAQAYFRGDSDAATSVHEYLTRAGKSIDGLFAEALKETLDYVERVDRLTAFAESRRNASLREIDRRRPILAEMLRPKVKQIEADELKVIDTTLAKKGAAA